MSRARYLAATTNTQSFFSLFPMGQYSKGTEGPLSPVLLFIPVKWGVEELGDPECKLVHHAQHHVPGDCPEAPPEQAMEGGGIISGKENKTFFGRSWGRGEAGEGEPRSHFLRSQ